MTDHDDQVGGRSEFDAWAEHVPEHVDAIRHRLSADQRQAARRASLERRRPFLVDPATGHTERTQLCWVCGTVPVHSGPRMPTFRACRFCLVHDRKQAARLGLVMLLPLMDWPSQPVLPGCEFPAGPAVREALADAWSGVSRLDAWRVSMAQLAMAWMDVDPELGVDLHQWQQDLTVGPNRSKACWSAYVNGYLPQLRWAVASSHVPEHRIVR